MTKEINFWLDAISIVLWVSLAYMSVVFFKHLWEKVRGMGDMKKKERPEHSPERPIEISKVIDKYIEKGGVTSYAHGMLLPDSSDSSGLSLETISPDIGKDEKNVCEEEK